MELDVHPCKAAYCQHTSQAKSWNMCVTFLCFNSSASSLLRFKPVLGLEWRLSPTTSF